MQIRIIGDQRDEVLIGREGQSLWELLVVHGYGEAFYCGGKGLCGKCSVRIREGAPPPQGEDRLFFDEKQLAQGTRLACRVRLDRDMVIEVPETNDIMGVVTEDGDISPLPERKDPGARFGVALDIGTTTLAFYLRDLRDGRLLASLAKENPQRRYGADCISRISFSQGDPERQRLLSTVLVKAIDEGLLAITDKAGVVLDPMDRLAIVGNTIMLHMLLGVAADSIAQAPFRPVFTDAKQLTGRELGLVRNASLAVELLPSAAGYVGSDIVADLLAVEDQITDDETFLLIDIGTNGEVVLGRQGTYWCCATAAGPAFEGASISCGMPSTKGAISTYRWNGKAEGFEYGVLGDGEPKGLCGSGLLDVTAVLVQQRYVDSTGRFQSDAFPGLQEHQGKRAFCLVPEQPLYVTQKDIREVQLAKGALAAGIQTLLAQAGVHEENVERVFLAGGFGQNLNPNSAATIGILPRTWQDKVVKIGNGAGVGAQRYLADPRGQEHCKQIVKKMRYIELSLEPQFQELFMDSMYFPPPAP